MGKENSQQHPVDRQYSSKDIIKLQSAEAWHRELDKNYSSITSNVLQIITSMFVQMKS